MQYIQLIIGFESLLSDGVPGKSGMLTLMWTSSSSEMSGFAQTDCIKRASKKNF